MSVWSIVLRWFMAVAFFFPFSLYAASVHINSGADPDRVTPGQETRLWMIVVENDTALANTNVAIYAGGGQFKSVSGFGSQLRNNGSQIHGKTNNDGQFFAKWSCDPCAQSYAFDAVAQVDGKKAHTQIEVGVNLTGPNAGASPKIKDPSEEGPLVISGTAATPGVVSGGEKTALAVVISKKDALVSNAIVSFHAGGGQFEALPDYALGSVPNGGPVSASGKTDEYGRFGLQWFCQDCADTYVIDVIAVKNGERAENKIVVDINKKQTQNHQACAEYANNAITQQYENKNRNCGGQGPAWHSGFSHHYNWCMHGRNVKVTEGETIRRNQFLNQCR